MIILKVVFRIDFKSVCTEFLDRRGTALAILQSDDKDFWDQVGETSNGRALTAKKRIADEEYRELTFSPNNLGGSIEFIGAGINPNDLHGAPNFTQITEIADIFLKKFEVTEIARAGIRFFVASTTATEKKDSIPFLQESLSRPIVESVYESLGEITDFAVTFVGEGDDDLSYRLNYGPLVEDDWDKFFPSGSSEDLEKFFDLKYNSVYDVDLFERDFSAKHLPSLRNWSRTKIGKTVKMIENHKAITESIG